MLRNYFKIAFRNLLRQKAFSFINIFGLAIGMACSILIGLWVQHELSYDRFHARADQLYRLTDSTPDIQAAVSPAPMAAALRAQLPEVKNTVRLNEAIHLFGVGNRKFEEKRVYYADSTFLDVFSFPLLQGDAKTALNRPDGILLTEAMAQKYFGGEAVLGQIIRKDNRDDLVVTGILADIPANSHLQFDFILPMAFLARTSDELKDDWWDNFNFYTYVQLDKSFVASPASLQKLEGRITRIYHGHFPSLKVDFQLQPVSSIHLHSHLLRDVPGNGNQQYVRIFSVVAVFLLVVAGINFTNLATARSAHRAREVGLRKVVGAGRTQLIGQFLGESLFISFLALLLATAMVWLLLPVFNDLSEKQLTLNLLNRQLMGNFLGVALLTGLLSGSYPALFLSRFRPVNVLKGNLKIGGGNVSFRNGLVVVQFVVSIILLVGTAVVYHQLQFIKNKNLGFDKENLLYVPITGDLWARYQALKTELQLNPLTSAYAVTQELPTNLGTGVGVEWEGKNAQTQPIFPTMNVDENFINLFRMKLVSGRSFSREFKADTVNYVVNEQALRMMGMEVATALGKPLTVSDRKGTIIGVVQDFHFKPVQQAIEPLILQFNTWGGTVVVRTKPATTEATIQALEKICGKLNPAHPFTYHFLDQDLARLYRGEQRMGSLFNVFALLAIFVSCLGLYGLSAFLAEQRRKEIGVRKVLGASVVQIVYLLSTNFARLILIAVVIALPLSWLAINNWLAGFAYRIEVNGSIFLVACLTCLLIAALTVSYESIKAALANPVRSLRNE
ncbi:MAG: ABC transporter permease [Ferruginibacter sp.]|nr:ABC transporter permease [Cytophagales bacterium]